MLQYTLSKEERLQLAHEVEAFRALENEPLSLSPAHCYVLSKKFVNEWKSYSGYSSLLSHTSPHCLDDIQQPPKPLYNTDIVNPNPNPNCLLSPDPLNPHHHQLLDNLDQNQCYFVTEPVMDLFWNYEGYKILRQCRIVEGFLSVELVFPEIKFIVVSEWITTKTLSEGREIPVCCVSASKWSSLQQLKKEISEYWVQEYMRRISSNFIPPPQMLEGDVNVWIVEEEILNHDSQFMYRNIITQGGTVHGSKVTGITEGNTLQPFLSDPNLVLIIEIIPKNNLHTQACIYCGECHPGDTACAERSENSGDPNGPNNLVPKGFPGSLGDLSIRGVGLRNTGNTCYMNSVLQALVHTPHLKAYFLSHDLKHQCNKENPLGTNGQLALSFSKLILEMIKSRSSHQPVDPSQIKNIISRKNPIFKGHAQQDAQEFLMTILDLIHEDLNKVTKRVFQEGSTQDDHTGAKSWEVYRHNNNSVVTELFGGQYKSQIVCSNCDHKRMVFEPFLNFSLQIPQKDSSVKIVFCGYGRKRLYYQVDLCVEQVSVASITKNLSSLLHNTSPKRLRMLNWRNDFGSVESLPQDKLLEAILRKEIICYELSEEETILFDSRSLEKISEVVVSFKRTGLQREVPPNRPFWFHKDATIKDIYRRVWFWLYQASIEDRVSEALKNQSLTTIFASFFLKSPPLQIAVKVKPENKQPFYYERQFLMNLKVFEEIQHSYGTPQYEIECNIDKLIPFCDPTVFGKVGSIGAELKPEGELTIEQCIEKFRLPEELSQENMMICERCETKVAMTKTISLNKIGRYLVIHLKRFKQRMAFRYKNSRFIEYPVQIKMSDHVNIKDSGDNYELYAVINHSGTLNSGHYTTYLKEDNVWYLCNDHLISVVSEVDVVTENAYMLFYNRRE